MNRVSKEQIQEWTENPVTEALFKHCQDEVDAIKETPVDACLIPGEAQKTQDNLVTLNTRRHDWELFQDLLEGDWEYFVESDRESDNERDLSERE